MIIHKCVLIKHALKAQSLGVDAISIDGSECAGHLSREENTSLILMSRAAQVLKIPYIASGGFSDGRSAAAAFVLGACAVNMGTRFMCTVEAPVHENVKKAIVDAKETDTSVILKPLNNSVRCYNNEVSRKVEVIEKDKGKDYQFSDVRELMAGARGRTVYSTGNIHAGIWSCGQVIGVINDIPTCKELIDRLERETIDILSNTVNRVVGTKSKL